MGTLLPHVLSCPKLGLEPNFHDPGIFDGFRKHGQTHKPTRFLFYDPTSMQQFNENSTNTIPDSELKLIKI